MKIVKLFGVFVLALIGLAVIGQILPRPKAPQVGTIVTLPSGMQVNTYQKGNGQTLILTHGLPGSAGDWPALVDALAARGFHVVWYDRIGYGHSSRRAKTAPHTMQVSGQELDQLITAMELGHPALVGWSFGGGTVQTSQAAHHEDTPFIVLLAAIGPALSTDNKPSNPSGASIAMRMPILGDWITQYMAKQRFNDPVPDWWMRNLRPTLLMKGAIETMNAEIEQLDPINLHPSTITTPALVIQGRKDIMVAYSVGVDLAERLPNGTLLTLDDAGHMLPMSYPQSVADAIKLFADLQVKTPEGLK